MFTFLAILEQDFRNYLQHSFKQQGKINTRFKNEVNKIQC